MRLSGAVVSTSDNESAGLSLILNEGVCQHYLGYAHYDTLETETSVYLVTKFENNVYLHALLLLTQQ